MTVEEFKNLSYSEQELIVSEALLKRIVLSKAPIMLKGSVLTRQYFHDPSQRIIADLDLLYMEHIENPEVAHKIFTSWMILWTEMKMVDFIQFRSFTENIFWRQIDYAMDDDFPTINTDLEFTFTDEKQHIVKDELCVDITFNLPIPLKPVSFEYQTYIGEKITIPYTAPLSVQIAWKLHQTIIRPRFKDLYDLQFLLTHHSFTHQTLDEIMLVLADECKYDPMVKKNNIKKLFTENLIYLEKDMIHDSNWKEFKQKQACSFKYFAKQLHNIFKQKGLNDFFYKNILEYYTN